jgi:phosphatidylinositol alpha-1,6-mannosyltransferase
LQNDPSGIVLLSELFPPAIGGTPELFWNVYSRIDDLSVRVITGAPATIDVDVKGLTITRANVHYQTWGLLGRTGLTNHLNAARAIRAVGDPTAVIHCARVVPEGLTALMSAALHARPYVCWIHGEELAYVKMSRELSWLMRQTLKRSAALIANSHNTAAMLDGLVTPGDRIHVVYPGVDTERFRPNPAARARLRAELAPNGELLLLTVGRLQRRKGHDLVIAALGDLSPHARRSTRYVIVGDGNERAYLEGLAVAHRVQDRVTFAGSVPYDALPDYYAAADVFVHPNRQDGGDFEGFGMVFLEAAAAALPVIGGASGGVPEAVAEGVTGILVRGTDAVELRDALDRLIRSPDLRARMGAAGHKRVLAEFTWGRTARLVSTIHREVTSRNRPI